MTSRFVNRTRGPAPARPFPAAALAAALLLAAGGLFGPRALQAQEVEERFPGVSLGLTYEGRRASTLAIQPFTGRMGGGAAASRAENIMARDLRYSNRFTVVDSLPEAVGRETVDYALWDQLGADFLVTGRVEGAGGGAVLFVELHDVIYRQVKDRGRFTLPDPDHRDFRMAVHAASDAVVLWATGEPGIAATRIAFSRRMEDGSQDLWIVDSDGENLRRLTQHRASETGYPISLSAAWSPDGGRIAYTSYKDEGLPRIFELNLVTGEERKVPAPRSGDYITPAYHPNGEILAFSVVGGNRSGLFTYDIARQCCFANLSESPRDDLSPTFSPDGRRLAFNSNRLGVATPQIYVMNYNGSGRPEILSPYRSDRPGFYTSPDWSPLGDRVAYHGRIQRRGQHQILVSELRRQNRIVQLTFDGNNQDPSWAPDGRHLVFVGERSWGHGLFVVDAVTGNTRTLVSGMRVNLPAWSPSLAPRLADDR